MKLVIKILLIGLVGILISKGCSLLTNQQVANVNKQVKQREELFAKKYMLVYLHTDGMQKLCEASGYIPTSLISDFKVEFSSTINENNKYIDNLKDFDIFQETLQNLRNTADKENMEAYHLLASTLQQKIGKNYSLKDYCNDMDSEKDKIIQRSKEILSRYNLSQ